MTYSEYYNRNDCKIKIERKSYFFRDAIKLYLRRFSSKSEQSNISELIIEAIFDVIKNNDFELDVKNKIIITDSIVLQLLKKKIIMQNSQIANRILQYLKNKAIISKRSKLINEVYEEYDVNKLTSNFIHTDLSMYDTVLNLRDNILNVIKTTVDETTKEQYLYFYLKLFSIKKYSKEVYKNFSLANLYNLDGTVVLIYMETLKAYKQVRVVYFDDKLNEVLKSIFFNESDNLFDKINYYFDRDTSYYEKQLEKFIKDLFISVKGEAAKYHKSKFKQLIQNQIQLEYQFYTTAFHTTLQGHTLHPKTSYLELVKLFPKQLDNQNYIKIEEENIELQKTTHYIDEDEFIEMDIKDYISLDLRAYDELKKFRNFQVANKREYKTFKKKLDAFVDRNKEKFQFPEMLFFVQDLIEKSKFSDSKNENYAASTLQAKLSIIFFICFDRIVEEGKIDNGVVELIKGKIDSYTNANTKSKYIEVVNRFLNQFNYSVDGTKSGSMVFARKSLIFKKELDELYLLYSKDFSSFNDDVFIETHQKFIFCLLMYYAGTRESELWSREVQDIYIIDGEIFLDIHSNSELKSLKTQSAKRRIEFFIEDPNYFELFQRYLSILEEKKIKYLFPKSSTENKIFCKRINSLTYFTSCNTDIQNITKRYTSLHSFRHTYITNNFRKLLQSDNWNKRDVYNLINMVGHLGPEVTLQYYAHIDYVMHYKNTAIF